MGALVLVVRRLANGRTSAQWYAKWKTGGQRRKRAIGRWPDMTLGEARQRHVTVVAPLLLEGKDPRLSSAVVGKLPTVERMFQGYIDHMRAKGRASADEVERSLLTAKAYAAADQLGRNRLASSITDQDVVALVAGFYERGQRGAADKTRAYVSAAFGWARKATNDYTNPDRQDWGITQNPATDVPRDTAASKARDRNLSRDDLRALWSATRPKAPGFSVDVAACIRLLIACGQRVQETLRIDGADIDLDGGLWRMPAHKTKGGKRPHVIPLPRQAIDVLRELIVEHGDGPLFPARPGAKADLIDHRSIMQAIERWTARDDVDVKPFQSRDLRRSWKSRTTDAGIDRFTRDLYQQHAQNSDTGSKHYDFSNYLPMMRDAMAKWSEWIKTELE